MHRRPAEQTLTVSPPALIHRDRGVVAAVFGRKQLGSQFCVGSEYEQRRNEREYLSAHFNIAPDRKSVV